YKRPACAARSISATTLVRIRFTSPSTDHTQTCVSSTSRRTRRLLAGIILAVGFPRLVDRTHEVTDKRGGPREPADEKRSHRQRGNEPHDRAPALGDRDRFPRGGDVVHQLEALGLEGTGWYALHGHKYMTMNTRATGLCGLHRELHLGDPLPVHLAQRS